MNPNARVNKLEVRASDLEKACYQQLSALLREPLGAIQRRLLNREASRHGIGPVGPMESRQCPGIGRVANRPRGSFGMRRQV